MRPGLVTPVVAAIFLLQGEVSAKRVPPKKVKPVFHKGIQYRAPHKNMGCVEAWDTSTGTRLWEKKVYSIWIKPWLEADVQWVFIAQLKIEDGKLVVIDERDRRYLMNLLTGEVEGARLGLAVWLVAALVLGFLGATIWHVKKRRRAG